METGHVLFASIPKMGGMDMMAKCRETMSRK